MCFTHSMAEQMPDEDTTVVALLHGVVDDTPFSLEDLRKMGFSETVLSALALMTHDDGIPYMEYVARLKDNPIARTVKLADLYHNSDLTRLDSVEDQALQRAEKYAAAIKLLEEAGRQEDKVEGYFSLN